MRNLILVLLILLTGFNCFSSDYGKLKSQNYPEKINELVYRLGFDPANRHVKQKLLKTYTEAALAYEQEFNRLKQGTDSFKWTKTFELMSDFNSLSDDILNNSYSVRLICNPQYYTGELLEARQKSVHELYWAGNGLLQSVMKRDAQKAYSYFVKVGEISPEFEDVGAKIQEAETKATLNLVVDKVEAYANYKNLITERFYQELLNKLQFDFLKNRFVHIYSTREAKQRKIDHVNWHIQISFTDFQFNMVSSFDNTSFMYINASAEVRIFSSDENQNILSKRVPGQYIWKNYPGGGDSDLQGLFDAYSLSATDDLFELLADFIRKSNY